MVGGLPEILGRGLAGGEGTGTVTPSRVVCCGGCNLVCGREAVRLVPVERMIVTWDDFFTLQQR